MKTTRKPVDPESLYGVTNRGVARRLRVAQIAIINEAGEHELSIPVLLAVEWTAALNEAVGKVAAEFAGKYVGSFFEREDE